MHLNEEIIKELTNNQYKLLKALCENPDGLLSSELASKTSVSNKSATITENVKKILEKNNLKLVIQRESKHGHQALWRLEEVEESDDCCLFHDGLCELEMAKQTFAEIKNDALAFFVAKSIEGLIVATEKTLANSQVLMENK
jgi:hypothetical protein